MKKIFKNSLFTFIFGALMFGGIGFVIAEEIITAQQVGYTKEDGSWISVDEAIDELYNGAGSGNSLYEIVSFYGARTSIGYNGSNSYVVLRNIGSKKISFSSASLGGDGSRATYLATSPDCSNYTETAMSANITYDISEAACFRIRIATSGVYQASGNGSVDMSGFNITK